MHNCFLHTLLQQELWSKVATEKDGTVSSRTKLITVPLSQPSIAGEVVRTGKLINVPDCYKDARFYQAVDDKVSISHYFEHYNHYKVVMSYCCHACSAVSFPTTVSYSYVKAIVWCVDDNVQLRSRFLFHMFLHKVCIRKGFSMFAVCCVAPTL